MARKRTGSLVLRARNGVPIWHAQMWVGQGEDKRRAWYSLGTSDKATAKRKLAQLARQMRAAEASTENPTVDPTSAETFRSYSDAWLERRRALGVSMTETEASNLKIYILPILGPLPLVGIRAAQVNDVIDRAVVKGLARSSIVQIRGVMNRIFTAAVDAEIGLTSNPVTRARVPNLDEVVKPFAIVTDEEFDAFMAYPGDPTTAPNVDPSWLIELKMLSLLSRCVGGMRGGDLNAWNWTHIDRAEFATCIVLRRKTRKKRPPQRLEIPAMVRPFLRAWHEVSGKPDSGPVFPIRLGPRAGEFKGGHRSYANRLRRELKKAIVWAKLPVRPELFDETDFSKPVNFHSFRRSFKTALAEAHVDPFMAMHLSGSTDPKSHSGYIAPTTTIPVGALPPQHTRWALPMAKSPGGATVAIVENDTNQSGSVEDLPLASSFA